MNSSKNDETKASTLVSWGWVNESNATSSPVTPPNALSKRSIDLLRPVRQWLDQIEVKEAGFAHFLCKQIPSQCPFERRVQFKGRTLLYIPPLCKLNPVYNEVVALRFRALCYLADVCGEDISSYC
ncbi:MAG: Mo-dependent nitrogenase C-terminal domain-containing protein [Cyanobacteria bacterium CAN_BIN43]|nr:Mo-dependent nitrogenase C-terminal domain-containing protein [Cyanobacteria bacterium CAN_BIN43]